MKLHDIKSTHKNKKRTRIARGIAGKGGKTGGRGTKGQKARTGFNIPAGFEGGQTKTSMRMPKIRGFKNLNKENNFVVRSSTINKFFKADEEISVAALIEKKVIKELKPKQQVKILFDEAPKFTYKITDCLASRKVKNYKNK